MSKEAELVIVIKMRASIIIIGLALMAIYIVHCDAFAIGGDSALIRIKRTVTTVPNTKTVTTLKPPAQNEPGLPKDGDDEGKGEDKKDDNVEGNDKPADEKDSKTNAAIGLKSSPFKMIPFAVLSVVAAKIIM